MSVQNLDKFAVYDPRLVLDNKRAFAVLKGGQQVTYYSYATTGAGSNSWAFSTNPPSKKTVLDRLAFISVHAKLTFAGTGAGTGNILQPGRDALRSFPISSIVEILTSRLNGQPVSVEMAELIHLLERFHFTDDMKRNVMSYFPSMPDNVQNYSDADGFNNNPLAQYGDNSSINPRGAYRMVVSSNTTTGAVVDIDLFEPIMLPPFIMDGIKNQAGGLANLDTLDWNFTLTNRLERMWSRSTANTQNLSSISVQFSNQAMLLGWITPNLTQQIPDVISYPYYQINKYVTQHRTDVFPNFDATITSNVVQFDSVPRKIYLYAIPSRNDILNNFDSTVHTSDTFFKIENVNINWDNQSGILAGATPLQLYNFSAQNGLNIPYNEFQGITQQLSAVGVTVDRGLTGSIVCLEIGKDIGLRSDLAPGSLAKINFQATVKVRNLNQTTQFKPDLYVVAVYDGILEVGNNYTKTALGVLNQNDVLESNRDPVVSYSDIEKLYGGGNFFSRFGNIGKSLLPIVQKVLPVAQAINKGLRDSKAISKSLGAIESAPYIGAPAAFAKPIAEALGYGYGGVVVGGEGEYDMGGRKANVNTMKKRLAKSRK